MSDQISRFYLMLLGRFKERLFLFGDIRLRVLRPGTASKTVEIFFIIYLELIYSLRFEITKKWDNFYIKSINSFQFSLFRLTEK